jgi:tetratricopeptide (TPR) repeat protein
MENDKWVWGDEEEAAAASPALLQDRMAPIVDLPHAGPRQESGAPATAAPARKEVAPSVVQAIVLHLEGDLEGAIAELEAGLKAGEPPAELYTAMGALQMELERYEDAAKSYREVLKRDPSSATAKRNLDACLDKLNAARKPPKTPPALVKAIVLHMEKKIEEAIRELQTAVKSGEDSVEALAALGHLQFEAGRFDAAASAYQKVIEREPLHRTCHYNLAVCLEKLGRHKEALASFEEARRVNSERVEMGIGVGVALLHLKRYEEAAAAFTESLQSHPDDAAALFGKAFALQNLDRKAEAAAAYLEVLKREPSQEETLANLITVLAGDPAAREHCLKLLAIRADSRIALENLVTIDLASGDFESAAPAAERLTRIAPDSFEAWFNCGVACAGAKRFDVAVASFSRAAKMRPKSAEAQIGLAQALHGKGDLPAARSAYEAALKLSPDNPALLWTLAQISEQTGAPREAEKYCALLAAKAPASETAWFRLGTLRYQRGDYSASAEAFRNALKADAESSAAQLNLGLALWKSGQLKEARAALEAIATAPHAAEALHHLAAIAVEREDYDRALELYARIAADGDRSPELFYNTGLILQNLGRTEEAAAKFREALALKPDLAEAKQALSRM